MQFWIWIHGLTRCKLLFVSIPGPILLTWINFNLGMIKSSLVQWSIRWNYFSIPKCQWCNRWNLEWINNFIPHIMVELITYKCWDLIYSYSMLIKGATGFLVSTSGQQLWISVKCLYASPPFPSQYQSKDVHASVHKTKDRVYGKWKYGVLKSR